MSDYLQGLLSVGLVYYAPDGTLKNTVECPADVQKFLNYPSDKLSEATPETLKQGAQTLGTYLLHVGVEYNKYAAEYVEVKGEFDKQMGELSFSKVGATIKERESKTLQENPHLKELKKKMVQCEAWRTSLENIPDYLTEKINLFKKFYDARVYEHKFTQRP